MSEKAYRDGIPIEKGVTLTSNFLDDNQELFTKYLNYWILYPDLFLDEIQPTEDAKTFHLAPYQRIALRASMRYRYHFWTATRATSKSFTTYLSALVRAILLPKSKIFISSDIKQTVVKVAKEKFNEFFEHWPLLKNELKTREDDGEKGEKNSNDYYELNFKNGSKIGVIAKDSTRGMRANSMVLEEAATLDGYSYNNVLLPQLNIVRREPDGTQNAEEPVSPQTFITTARERTVFMYSKLIELTAKEVLQPEDVFVWGLSYEVPLHYGILNKKIMMDQRFSTTMDEESFSRENLSIWTGNNQDAWLNSEKLNRRRTLLKCERKAPDYQANSNTFYIMGVDVGRYNANTAIMIIKVLPGEKWFRKNIVYTEILHGENFITEQAPRLKKLIQLFNPKEVVIDGNGIGGGLMDAMAIPSIDQKTGEHFPAYYSFNNDKHLPPDKQIVTLEPQPSYNAILYDIKAGRGGDNDAGVIHSNFFAQINNGSVSFLAPERIVREKLLKTNKGKKMTMLDRRLFLFPYEMTSRLIDELNNLKVKDAGSGIANDLKVERISKSIEKDRFSALEYGLFRVKYYEDKATFRKRRKKNIGQYNFFTPKERNSGR